MDLYDVMRSTPAVREYTGEPLPDETLVLSGHGAETTIGQERVANPILQEAAPFAPPSRGL